jgi:hypothetical protein
MNSVMGADACVESLGVLPGFRRVLYGCFTLWGSEV